jgi:CheY-like chemotaxis protein
VAVARNLSRWGIAYILGQFVYPDAQCAIILPDLDGKARQIGGRVVRCRHVNGIMHAISVLFQEPLDLDTFIALSPQQKERYSGDLATECVKKQIKKYSCVLILHDIPDDRKLLGLWFDELGIGWSEAVDPSHALCELGEKHLDLVVVDQDFGDQSSDYLIEQFRKDGYTNAVLALSADETDATRNPVIDAGANVVLSKPLQREAIQQTVSQLLGVADGDDDEPILSSQTDVAKMRPLIKDFVTGLGGYVDKLNTANKGDDVEQLQLLCNQLKEAGDSYGFEEISEVAEQAIARLHAQEHDVAEVHDTVNGVLAILRRVRFE